VDVQLELGQITEQVVVAASAAVLQTDKTDVHVELDSKAVTALPLPNYRNYQSLIDLVPGATPAQFQNAITDTPARALTTNINGTPRNNNTNKLDGAANIFIWLPHHTVYVPPAESIETVNIATNNFDAEQGMAGGAAVTVTTKSGTNEFHGSAFAYHTNNKLKAKNFFYREARKPKNISNIDGFTIGGPLRRNKLFFFTDWEGNRERVNRSGLYTVPTADQRLGNLAAFNTTIYDPATGDASGRGRTPFSNNVIPAARQSAIARRVQDLIPASNQPGLTANYFASGTQAMNRDNLDAKVNWNRTNAHTIWGKYSVMDAQVNCAFALGAAGGPGLCDGGPGVGNTLVQLATIGHTWTFSPAFLIDGTIGWTRMGQNVKGPDYGTNYGLDVFGIPGTNGPDVRQSGLPSMVITGYTTTGNNETWEPLFRNDQSYTGTTNAGWIRGAHDLRFGFEFVRHQLNHWQPERGGGPRGRFTFPGGVTALSGGASPNQFNAYAGFLLGLPGSVQKSLQHLYLTGREWQFGGYLRDRWQATSKLTVTLGLRYEYYPLLTRADRGLERWDPDTNLVLVGRRGGNPDDVGITVSKKLYAPRFGVAYRLTGSTVFRTGYGITIDPFPAARSLRDPFPATIAADFLAPNSFVPYQPLERGIPAFSGPDISSGSVPLPSTIYNRSLWQGQLNRGYIQSWNFIAEQRFAGDVVGTVGYVGTRTIHQFVYWNMNAAPPGGGSAGRPLYGRFGRSVDTDMWAGWLDADYHSLQATVNRRFVNGLYLKGAYTFSRAINYTDDDGNAFLTWNHPSVLHRNRALAGYHIPHLLQLSFMYELPFGPGKAMAPSGAVSQLARGWTVNGVFSAFQGRPFTVGASGASLNAPGNSQTADQVIANVDKLGGIGRESPFYDPSAFRAVTEVRYGTSGRNILLGPGVVNLQLSVFRTFDLTERFDLQFRAEAFNVSNTPHFNNPSADASNPVAFMRITGAQSDERQFRLGLRLSF
jgi:outer membrane receptor protein involved in Fe transport